MTRSKRKGEREREREEKRERGLREIEKGGGREREVFDETYPTHCAKSVSLKFS